MTRRIFTDWQSRAEAAEYRVAELEAQVEILRHWTRITNGRDRRVRDLQRDRDALRRRLDELERRA